MYDWTRGGCVRLWRYVSNSSHPSVSNNCPGADGAIHVRFSSLAADSSTKLLLGVDVRRDTKRIPSYTQVYYDQPFH